MKIELLNHTPLSVADAAIGKCYDKGCYTDTKKMKNRINNVANVKKHASTVEHLTYNFDINGVSRALLQELARHRIASYSVKSTRYTLKELKEEQSFICQDPESGNLHSTPEQVQRAENYLVYTGDDEIDMASINSLDYLRWLLIQGKPNDKAKYCLPESYKTNLVMTINARSLQNFIALRSSKHALWEIQDLAKAMYEALPEDHKFLFEHCLA